MEGSVSYAGHPVDRLTLEIISGSILQVMDGFLLDRKSQGLSPKILQCNSQELRDFHDYLAVLQVEAIEDLTAELSRRYPIQLAKRRNSGGCHVSYRVNRANTYWYRGRRRQAIPNPENSRCGLIWLADQR